MWSFVFFSLLNASTFTFHRPITFGFTGFRTQTCANFNTSAEAIRFIVDVGMYELKRYYTSDHDYPGNYK